MEYIGEPRWRKSTYSGNGGASCVEVADHDGMILVRDTKDHSSGPVHRYTPDQWRAFITSVRSCDLDLPLPSAVCSRTAGWPALGALLRPRGALSASGQVPGAKSGAMIASMR